MGRAPREREKPCSRCDRAAEALFRVRTEADGPWVFVCRACWDAVATGNPEYQYGGTWKARKRR